MHPRLRLDIGWADLVAALGPPRRDARTRIAAHWPDRMALTFLSVRSGLDALLKALAIGPGDEIVMSAVNIESMAEVVRAHGATIVPVDIDLATLAPSAEAVAAAITPRTRMVLVAHLFGVRVDLSPYAASRNDRVLLVEDCAQGWGGAFRGSPDADVSLFSFGPIKRRTALGGAVAAFRNPELARRCAEIEAAYGAMSDWWFLKRVAKFAALKLISAQWLYSLVLSAIQAATGDAERIVGAIARGFPPGDLIRRIRFRPPARMLSLLERRLRGPHDDNARIAAARDLMRQLGLDGVFLGSQALAHHFWLTPILVECPADAVLALRPLGYDVTRGATSLRPIGANAPNAHNLIEQVLYLPAPWEMSARERAAFSRAILQHATLLREREPAAALERT